MDKKYLKSCTPLYNLFADKKLPILQVNVPSSYSGTVGSIRPEEINHPVMCGIDIKNRPFICIRVVGEEKIKHHKRIKSTNDQFWTVGVFYKRYENSDEWAYTSLENGTILYHDTVVRKEDYDILEARLHKLLNKEIIRNIDFGCVINSQPLDLINGNGKYILSLH